MIGLFIGLGIMIVFGFVLSFQLWRILKDYDEEDKDEF